MLQGGADDVAPESYGETPLDAAWHGDRVRDRYEMALVDAFVRAGKPVFGMCRGLQLLNVHFGGTLLQDITTQVPDSQEHRRLSHYERHLNPIELVPGTRLAQLYLGVAKATKSTASTTKGIKDLAPGFSVEARCPDDGIDRSHPLARPQLRGRCAMAPRIPPDPAPTTSPSTTARCCKTSSPRPAPPRPTHEHTRRSHNPATGLLITELPADDAVSVAAKAARRPRSPARLGPPRRWPTSWRCSSASAPASSPIWSPWRSP